MDEEVISKVTELLGEHSCAWAVCAEDAEGNFWHDYSTPITARALHDYAVETISKQLDWGEDDIEWEECEDDGEGWKDA